jgi:hypothetical protein
MSYSEMNRTTYMAHRASIRANGERHGLKWIECPLERADMQRLCNQDYDHLLQRLAYVKLGTPELARNAFMLTTPFKASEATRFGA